MTFGIKFITSTGKTFDSSMQGLQFVTTMNYPKTVSPDTIIVFDDFAGKYVFITKVGVGAGHTTNNVELAFVVEDPPGVPLPQDKWIPALIINPPSSYPYDSTNINIYVA